VSGWRSEERFWIKDEHSPLIVCRSERHRVPNRPVQYIDPWLEMMRFLERLEIDGYGEQGAWKRYE
jgi:hypothetical protein